MRPFDELKQKLKNFTNGKRYISEFIRNQPINEPFRHEEIEQILQFHPEKEDKNVANIEYLVIRYRKPYNLKSLYIKSKQREEDDISYTMCLRRIFDLADIKTKNDITRAFRDTIYYTAMGRFRRQFPDKKCALCESTEKMKFRPGRMAGIRH